jgi:hypothetical protein
MTEASSTVPFLFPEEYKGQTCSLSQFGGDFLQASFGKFHH